MSKNSKKYLLLLNLLAISIIAGFQFYWLTENYQREKLALELQTSSLFKEVIAEKQKLELSNKKVDSVIDKNVIRIELKEPDKIKPIPKNPTKKPSNIQVTAVYSTSKTRKEKKQDSLPLAEQINTPPIPDTVTRDTLLKPRVTFRSSTIILSDTFSIKGQTSDIPDSINRTTFQRVSPVQNVISKIDPQNIKSITLFQPDKEKPLNKTQPKVNAGVATSTEPRIIIFQDSLIGDIVLPLDTLYKAFGEKIAAQKINVPYKIDSFSTLPLNNNIDSAQQLHEVTIGISSLKTYRLELLNTPTFLLRQISKPIIFSLLLLALTIFAFSTLYRNYNKQRRLTDIKNNFISNITHELKTPLATISVAIEALQNYNALNNPERTKEYLDISQHEISRLSLLVDKVLTVSQLEKQEIQLNYTPLNVDELVEGVYHSFKLQFQKAGAKSSLILNAPAIIEADRTHLLSVLYNMIDNALKYSPENPQITISTNQDNDWITVNVADNGIGIPAEYKEKVFEKFFRVPSGNLHQAKGYGLGLSYLAEIIKKHKGQIVLTNNIPTGTIITIKLPVKR